MNSVSPNAESVAYEAVKVSKAHQDCERYLFGAGRDIFRGRNFGIGYRKTPDIISVADLEALKFLGVSRNIRNATRQAEEFEKKTKSSELLPKIRDTSIREYPDYVQHTSDHLGTETECCGWKLADELWSEVRKVDQFGRFVVRSKLLARKRPQLFPIYDDYVGKALEIGTQERLKYSLWGTMQAVAQSDRVWKRVTTIHQSLFEDHDGSQFLEGVSPLRVLDIILWMKYRKL